MLTCLYQSAIIVNIKTHKRYIMPARKIIKDDDKYEERKQKIIAFLQSKRLPNQGEIADHVFPNSKECNRRSMIAPTLNRMEKEGSVICCRFTSAARPKQAVYRIPQSMHPVQSARDGG